MSHRGKHPFDLWEVLAIGVGTLLMVVGITGLCAGVVMLAERMLP